MPMPYGADLDIHQTGTKQTCGRTDQNVKKCVQHRVQGQEDQHRDQRADKVHSYVISNVRKRKWSWAGHINPLKDDRWTSRVTTWRPYDNQILPGRRAKRWRDLDKFWRDAIWQKTAQDMLTWRRHAEAFARPRVTTAAN